MKAIKKISTKLLLAFAVVLALVMALGYSSLTAIGGLGGALDVAVNGTAKKLRLVGDLQAGFQEMRVDAAKLEISLTNTIIGRLDTRQGSAESTYGSCHTSDTVETRRQQFEAVAARLSAQVAQLRTLVAGDGERQAAHTVETGIAEWLALYRQYLKLTTARDYTAAHEVMLDRIYPLVESMDKAAKQLAVQQQELLAASSREARVFLRLLSKERTLLVRTLFRHRFSWTGRTQGTLQIRNPNPDSPFPSKERSLRVQCL